jgi:hypothetical protein
MIMPLILLIHQQTENHDMISVVVTELRSRISEEHERALESSILDELEALRRGKTKDT